MYKAYKFRMYPNKEQQELINKTFGCARFIYNYYLDKSKNNNYQSAFTNIKDYTTNLKHEYPFLQEVDSIVIRKSLFNLEDAFKMFFKNEFGYPKYKSKYNKNSYNTNAVYGTYKNKEYCNIELNLENKKIKLPKLKWINIKGYRKLKSIKGRIINSTISREPNQKYYVSVLCELPDIKHKVKPNSIVGIDLGIKKQLTLSDGETIENNKYIKKYEKRIKRKQRELSRKVKRSNNYNKCKKELAILHSKLANARKYYIHKVTKVITDTYDIITCEKLNLKRMIEEKKLSKELTDVTLSEIIRQIEYKSKNKGKYFYQIDTYYPSSQICSRCDNRDSEYKDISRRTYECKNCGNILDRDINASINIMWEGIKLYMKSIA